MPPQRFESLNQFRIALRSQRLIPHRLRLIGMSRQEYVLLVAAKVGGILANDMYPAAFLYQNLMIETNGIESARLFEVKKRLSLGGACIYPRMAPQPLKEEYLLTGPLKAINEWCAVAKIAGIELCQACQRQFGSRFISAIPANLYGQGDNLGLESSNFLPP